MFLRRTCSIALALLCTFYCTGFAKDIAAQPEKASIATQKSSLKEVQAGEDDVPSKELEKTTDEEDSDIASEELLDQVLDSGEIEDTSLLAKTEIDMVNVLVPIDISFQIDPFEINGQGQIYSDQFGFYNYGNTDVVLRIVEYNCTFDNETEDLILLNEPFDWRTESPHKEIYLALKFESHDFPMLIFGDTSSGDAFEVQLKAAEFDADGNFLSISEGGALLFRMDGNVNHMPAKRWESGEVQTSVVFSLENVGSEDEPETIEDEPETDELAEEVAADEPEEAEESEPVGEKVIDLDVSGAEGSDNPVIERTVDLQQEASEDAAESRESDDEIVIDLPQTEGIVELDIEVSTDPNGVVSIDVSDENSEASETSDESG